MEQGGREERICCHSFSDLLNTVIPRINWLAIYFLNYENFKPLEKYKN